MLLLILLIIMELNSQNQNYCILWDFYLDIYSTINNNKYKEENELKQEILELNEKKDKLFFKIQSIVNLFLYCLRNINKVQEKKNRNDIDIFFTL